MTEEGLERAEEVAQRTEELLTTQGWCLWQCETLDGDIVLIMDDSAEPEELPAGYPTYTISEINILFGGDKLYKTLRLVHEGKKLAGAKVKARAEGDY